MADQNGHYYPKSKLNSDLMLPEKQLLDAFKRMAMEVFRVKLSSDKIKDCLWLSYGDVVVASKVNYKAR